MPELAPALPGRRIQLPGPAGDISAYVDGQGPPLLLVHSVNAAASAAEVRPLHLHYRASRTVWSVDLPGFGFSQRSPRAYTPRLMTDAVLAVAERIGQAHGPTPIDALALSLSCEFLARAAVEHPGRFRSLALVSPTGLTGRRELRRPEGSTLAMPWLLAALRGPGWGRAVFRGLTRPGVIRYFLQRTWGSKRIDEALWAYAVQTAAQPDAEHAPLHFVAGYLFSADINTVYDALRLPVWVSHGVRGDFTDYRGVARLVERRSHWRVTEFPTGALPQFEVPERFVIAYDAILEAGGIETQLPNKGR